MEVALFILIALVTVVSALLVIIRKNAVSSVLFLVLTFFCLAMLYVMLGAQFIAAMQVIVYAGAIMVLFIFVVMLLNLGTDQKWEITGPVRKWMGFGSAAGILLIAVLAFRGMQSPTTEMDTSIGTVSSIGETMFQSYVLPFEVASVLLLAAIIGVVAMISRKPVDATTVEGGNES
ncbi:MAG: NADH-quinone oxidoreductase subunit J [Calditrichaeota bacterium]|jgi:NADH-quinone oxidoreductase subunit J|nr:NADH-quinone oxidoreductase subunit J [Calditrichota bacterium]MBT7619081.1 NADH-quinone oxidoreductase subunit J [Calditrichota bacterium]MBT7788268.1 NADH-quinone oxidoreductase subunit J [Calditrichota bacterium]